jgi:hypothetical protein
MSRNADEPATERLAYSDGPCGHGEATRALLLGLSETLALVGEGAPLIAVALRRAAAELSSSPPWPAEATGLPQSPASGPAPSPGDDRALARECTPALAPAAAPARNAPGGTPALAPARDARERTPERGHAGAFVISVEAARQMRDAFAGRVRAVAVAEPDAAGAAGAALSVTRDAEPRQTNGELGAAREPASDDRRLQRWMPTEVRPTPGTADGGAAWGQRRDEHARATASPWPERAPLYFSLACLPPQTSERAFKRALRAGLPVTKLGYSEVVTPSAWLAWLERAARPRVSAARAALPSTPSDDEMLASVGAKPRKR